MNILLVHPPHNRHALTPSHFEPLALEILAATVPAHRVQILDLRFDPLSELDRHINHLKPQVVGLTVNNTIHVNQSRAVLKYIKKNFPEIMTVVGGHHPTLMPEDFYDTGADAIFLGWAEKSFPAYINHLQSALDQTDLTGVILLKSGQVIYQNRQLPQLTSSDIPRPNRLLTVKYQRYYRNEIGQKYALVNTARGCPYRCSFCACWKAAGGHYLVRSAVDVFREICDISPAIHRIFFADDFTFFDVQRSHELYRLIKESGIRKKYTGYCRSDIIVKYPDLFREWKEIGLENLTIGFEAISDDQLRTYGKRNQVAVNEKAAKILEDINVRFSAYFLIEPDFEKADFEKISQYVMDRNLVRPRFVVLTPLPGTELFDQLKNRINLDYDYFDFMHWVYPTRLAAIEFFYNLMRLYYTAFSFRRYFKILFKNILSILLKKFSMTKKLPSISFLELLALRIMAFPLRQKLYKQYFQADQIKKAD